MPSSKNYTNVSTCITCGKEFTARRKLAKSCSVNCRNILTFDTINGNPELYLKYLLNIKKHKRKNISLDYMLGILHGQDGKCAISGQTMTFSKKLGQGSVNTNCSIDQIKPDAGYVEGNVQLVCSIVNKMKLDMDMEELYFWCSNILKEKDHP